MHFIETEVFTKRTTVALSAVQIKTQRSLVREELK